jgi:hypothetical protein
MNQTDYPTTGWVRFQYSLDSVLDKGYFVKDGRRCVFDKCEDCKESQTATHGDDCAWSLTTSTRIYCYPNFGMRFSRAAMAPFFERIYAVFREKWSSGTHLSY